MTEAVGGTTTTDLTFSTTTLTIAANQRYAPFTVTAAAGATTPETVVVTATDPTNTAASATTSVNLVASLPTPPCPWGWNDMLHGPSVDAVFKLWAQHG